MTTAAPLFIRSETPTILAMGLASNMLGLLVNGPNSVIQEIVRERLLDNSGEMAQLLHNELMAGDATDTQRTAVIVANFVRHLLQTTVRETQEKMDCRGF
jgi:hypothetical protein